MKAKLLKKLRKQNRIHKDLSPKGAIRVRKEDEVGDVIKGRYCVLDRKRNTWVYSSDLADARVERRRIILAEVYKRRKDSRKTMKPLDII